MQRLLPRCLKRLRQVDSTKSGMQPNVNHKITFQEPEPIPGIPNPEVNLSDSVTARDLEWVPVKVDLRALPQQYLRLSKIRLTSLVVVTTVAGYILAPAPFDPVTLALVSVGTGLMSCAANSINQFLEVPFDAQMARTKSRVLVLQGLR